jgi:hypothetical protein
MTERDYTKRLVKLFNAVPGCKCRTLPDSGVRGHKKPYDFFIIYKGIHISVEAKLGQGKLEEHQKKALQEDYDAGAKCFVVRYDSTGFAFYPFKGIEEKLFFTVYWNDAKLKMLSILKVVV